jgi:hypothetical protein
MNHGRAGKPAISMPSARTIARPWILLLATAMISNSVTTADSPASSPIGIRAGTRPGWRIPLNDIVAITYTVVTAITVPAR